MSTTHDTYCSKLPDLEIPCISYPDFMMGRMRGEEKVFLINGLSKKTLTNHQLVEAAEKMATALGRLGVGKGDKLATLIPNTEWYFPILFGSLLVGGTVALGNPMYSLDEMKNTVGLVSPTVIFTISDIVKLHTEEVLRALVPDLKYIILLDTIDDINPGVLSLPKMIANVSTVEYTKAEIDCDNDIALIPFSSGTSGANKGVCLTHRNIVANVLQLCHVEMMFSKENDSSICILPLFHVYGFGFASCQLYLREVVVIISKFEPKLFLSTLQDYKITRAFLVPYLIAFLVKSPLIDDYDLSSLRMVGSGAAPMSAENEILFKERFGIELRSGYGMSELSTAAALSMPYIKASGNCGVLLPNMKAKVICPDTGKSMKTGESGEILWHGPNVCKSYYNNPKATQELFQDGYLRSGDIGYFDENGSLYIIDRLKEMIKYKGFQVAPAEIEGILHSHPEIDDICIVGKQDSQYGELATAFVVLKKGSVLSESDINKWYEPKVSQLKRLHGGIIFVPSIPRNPAGKILRRVLRQQYFQ